MDAWLWRWGNFLFVTSPDSIVLTIWQLEQLKRGLIWEEHPSPFVNAPGLSLPAELHPVGLLDCGQLRLELGFERQNLQRLTHMPCVLSRERLWDLLRSIWRPICRSIGHFWSKFWRWWFLLPSKVSASFLDQEFWSALAPFGASSTTSSPFEWIHQSLWQLPTEFLDRLSSGYGIGILMRALLVQGWRFYICHLYDKTFFIFFTYCTYTFCPVFYPATNIRTNMVAWILSARSIITRNWWKYLPLLNVWFVNKIRAWWLIK